MSRANVRAGIVTAIEAITPTTVEQGATSFRHVDRQDVDDMAQDRRFAVLATSGHRVGEVSTTDVFYITNFMISFWYQAIKSVVANEDRIGEDFEAIQAVLINASNIHSDIGGVESQGDNLINFTKLDDENGNAIVQMPLTLRHK